MCQLKRDQRYLSGKRIIQKSAAQRLEVNRENHSAEAQGNSQVNSRMGRVAKVTKTVKSEATKGKTGLYVHTHAEVICDQTQAGTRYKQN